MEEEKDHVAPGPAPDDHLNSPPATTATSRLSLEEVLQDAEKHFKKFIKEEISLAIVALQGKSSSRPRSF